MTFSWIIQSEAMIASYDLDFDRKRVTWLSRGRANYRATNKNTQWDDSGSEMLPWRWFDRFWETNILGLGDFLQGLSPPRHTSQSHWDVEMNLLMILKIISIIDWQLLFEVNMIVLILPILPPAFRRSSEDIFCCVTDLQTLNPGIKWLGVISTRPRQSQARSRSWDSWSQRHSPRTHCGWSQQEVLFLKW